MSNPIEIRFPEDQNEGTEAIVSRWLVKPGDSVAAHDPLVEIETDKVVVEVAAPQAGVIATINIQPDEDVSPGVVLCTLNTDAKIITEADSKPEPAIAEQSSASRLSPAVRQRIHQYQLDISAITGSGRDGRITLQDLDSLMTSLPSRQKDTAIPVPVTPSPATPAPTAKTSGAEIIPHDKMRKRIAKSMVESLMHTAPHVTAVFEADLSAVFKHRAINKEKFASRDTPLTLTVYFIAAAIAAIQKVPRVNSRWFDEHLEIYQHINMGIGTALGDQGLIVPVLQAAQNMDLQDIAASLADLTRRARDGKLKPEDVRGGTFTISNHGVSGSLIATPIIINQPQSAILGIGKIEKRIRITEQNGEDVMVIRPMCYLSLTIDHRVVDGFQTNAFLTELVSTLENWPG